MLIVRLFPAEYGSSILIRDEGKKITNILIDGGTKHTYEKFLKSEIDAIVRRGEKIDLLVCTHIDCDHINGLIPLVDEYKSNQILNVWHNGFFQVVDKKFYNGANASRIAYDTEVLSSIETEAINQEEHNVGISECISFDASLLNSGIQINNVCNGQALIYNKDCCKFMVGPVEITLIGPTQKEIHALEGIWKEEMVARNYHFSVSNKIKLMNSFEIIMSRIAKHYNQEEHEISSTLGLESFCSDLTEIDNSVTNASSISFVIKSGNQELLILGDSVVDEEYNNRLSSIMGNEHHFTGMQLPHHGSRYNTNCDFLSRYTADEYYVLTNSDRFNHPDVSTMANVIVKNPDFKTLVFNYPIERTTFLNNPKWMEQYNYQMVIGDGETVLERLY